MSKRKIIDESDARVCLAGVLGSGLSLREWSRANGIDGRSLHMWRLALERRAAPSAPASGPLVRGVVELVPRAETLSGGSARYVLALAGARLEFDDNASPSMLRCVVEALRAC